MVWAIALSHSQVARAENKPAPNTAFLSTHCYDCHRGAEPDGGLDLTALATDLSDPEVERRWVQIVDRVRIGEMPPPEAEKVDPRAIDTFVHDTAGWIRASQQAANAKLGRVRARRLTRREVERSLHDLLRIDIPLSDQLPDDMRTDGFTTVADGQSISHFQIERHLAAVDKALDESFRRAFSPADKYERTFDAAKIVRTSPSRRCREPEMLDGRAVVWSSGLIFYGRLPVTQAPADGWYRFKVQASGLKLPETGGVWMTVRTGPAISSAPLLAWVTAFEATTAPRVIEFDAWLSKGEMLEIRPGDNTLKKARFDGGQVGAGEGGPQDVPGLALDWITMQRFHRWSDDDLRQTVIGGLAVKPDKKGRRLELVNRPTREDAVRLVENFARRAFRYPVSKTELAGYQTLVRQTFEQTHDLEQAVRVGYRAILCSPRFLYLTESPGKLNDHAIAARLSYFLTGSTPDAQLEQLAARRQLHDSATLHKQVDRLLDGPGGRRFVEDFADEWLDLCLINFTEPDGRLFPEFDPVVQSSMLDETRIYLQTMLRENMSVAALVDSDFTFLNSRLARYYDIPGVEGDAMRRVALKTGDRRGGVLTQGAVLKVTANGSNTSPVVRGMWVSDRLMGESIPPPPSNVPAIEPDIRGATTIREQLAKHRSQESCASCHAKIDPAGFALENYDPAGQWRERYLQRINGKVVRGAKVDSSYVLADGRHFADVEGFRSLLSADPRRLARCVAEKLVTYGTGAPISFADREAIEQIVDRAADDNYGFRSIVHAVVESPLFLTK
ncbi:MAG TPA: DUF1592 domain-containing protein [Pirellulales bacterium]|nr:DUF1592 domain-containing protein [Pirellulales bacterium]